MSIGTGISVKQKKNALFKLMNTLTKLQKVSDSFENIVVKIRFIYSIHLKADQIYFWICRGLNKKYLVVERSCN